MARILLALVCIGQVIAQSMADEPFCSRDMSGLKQVITIFRHGDRNPEVPFPSDIYASEDSWPMGWGHLLPKGMVRHHQFGKFMRNCYSSLLRDELKLKSVYVRATDVHRVIMSAQAHLSGAYPPKGIAVWGQEEKITLGRYWQPYPVYNVPSQQDKLVVNQNSCDRFQELYYDAYTISDKIKEVYENDGEIIKYLLKKGGYSDDSDFLTIMYMANTVLVEIEQNRKLVPWLNETLTDKLAEYFELWFEFMYNTYPGQARLGAGRLLQGIIDNMIDRKNAVDGIKTNTNYEHVIYSAHDFSVANLLILLGDWNHLAPPYAAGLIFELHKDDEGTWGVVLSYRNSTEPGATDDPVPVHIENCSGFMDWGCTLVDFLAVTRDKVASDLTEECKATRPPRPPASAHGAAPATTKRTTPRATTRATARATTRRTTTTTASPDDDWSN